MVGKSVLYCVFMKNISLQVIFTSMFQNNVSLGDVGQHTLPWVCSSAGCTLGGSVLRGIP